MRTVSDYFGCMVFDDRMMRGEALRGGLRVASQDH